MTDHLIAVTAFLAGTAFAWWVRSTIVAGALRASRARIDDLTRQLGEERRELEALSREHDRLAERLRSEIERRARAESDLDNERKGSTEKLAVIQQAETALSDAFKALSAEALKSNNRAFLDRSVGTLESRVLVSARKLSELNAAPEGVEIRVIEPVERKARALQSTDLVSTPYSRQEQNANVLPAASSLHVGAQIMVWYPLPCERNQLSTSVSRRSVTCSLAGAVDKPRRTTALANSSGVTSGLSVRSISSSPSASTRFQSVFDALDEEYLLISRGFSYRLSGLIDDGFAADETRPVLAEGDLPLALAPLDPRCSCKLSLLLAVRTPAGPTTLIALPRAAACGWRQDALAAKRVGGIE